MHILPLQIRFNDIDMMGHINNAIYLEFFDLGKEHYFTESEIDLYNEDFTMMIVHVDVDFHSQVHFSDRIGVTTKVLRFGNRSVEFEQHIVSLGADGKPEAGKTAIATCRTILSGYSRSRQASALVPDDVKERLARLS